MLRIPSIASGAAGIEPQFHLPSESHVFSHSKGYGDGPLDVQDREFCLAVIAV